MVKHYCDFCGTEVHQLNSYEIEITILPWEDNLPLTYKKRHQACRECMYKLIGILDREVFRHVPSCSENEKHE